MILHQDGRGVPARSLVLPSEYDTFTVLEGNFFPCPV